LEKHFLLELNFPTANLMKEILNKCCRYRDGDDTEILKTKYPSMRKRNWQHFTLSYMGIESGGRKLLKTKKLKTDTEPRPHDEQDGDSQ